MESVMIKQINVDCGPFYKTASLKSSDINIIKGKIGKSIIIRDFNTFFSKNLVEI